MTKHKRIYAIHYARQWDYWAAEYLPFFWFYRRGNGSATVKRYPVQNDERTARLNNQLYEAYGVEWGETKDDHKIAKYEMRRKGDS